MHYRLREDWRFFEDARRAKSFASALAAISFVLDTRFFDSLTASDSFAPANLLISRLSPVLAIASPELVQDFVVPVAGHRYA
jgi:hypothetical protein